MRFSNISPPVAQIVPIWVWACLLVGAELLAISLLYQHGFVFTCRASAPVWFCALLGRSVPRALGVLAMFGLFALARREALHQLLRRPGLLSRGLLCNLAGFALILLPWFFLSDQASGTLIAIGAACWVVGGILTVLGLLSLLAPGAAWRDLLAENGWTLAGVLGLGLILPEAGDYLQPLWRVEAITTHTFHGVHGLLSLLGYEVVTLPAEKVIGTEGFLVAVGPQCSGVEGFMLITAFVAFYLWLFRAEIRFPHALVLLPLGLAVSWLFNMLRITVLLMIGIGGQADLAVGAFHSHAGWLAFTVLSLLLILMSRSVPWFSKAPARAAPTAQPFLQDPAVVRILPFIVFMGSALLASTLSQNPGQYYPWRVLVFGGVLALIWPTLRQLPWRLDLLALAAGGGIAVLWIVTAPAEGSPPYGTLAGGMLALWVLFRLLGTVLFVPIIEELFFRDYLMSRLAPAGRGGAMVLAVLVSTVLFALLHDRWLVAGVAGAIFALLVWRSRNITDAILAHGVANGLIAIYAMATDSWHIL